MGTDIQTHTIPENTFQVSGDHEELMENLVCRDLYAYIDIPAKYRNSRIELVAADLQVSPEEINEAIGTLLRLGYIARSEDFYVAMPTGTLFGNPGNLTKEKRAQNHKQILQQLAHKYNGEGSFSDHLEILATDNQCLSELYSDLDEVFRKFRNSSEKSNKTRVCTLAVAAVSPELTKGGRSNA